MALKHPKAAGRRAGDHAAAPLFGLEPGRLSHH